MISTTKSAPKSKDCSFPKLMTTQEGTIVLFRGRVVVLA